MNKKFFSLLVLTGLGSVGTACASDRGDGDISASCRPSSSSDAAESKPTGLGSVGTACALDRGDGDISDSGRPLSSSDDVESKVTDDSWCEYLTQRRLLIGTSAVATVAAVTVGIKLYSRFQARRKK